MIVAVTGGRTYSDMATVRDVLSKLRPRPTLLIHGGAAGADTLCGIVAQELGIPVDVYVADWAKHGRGAGPIRNAEMLARRPDLLVAFPGGKGTHDAVTKARLADITVLYVGVAS